jgi:hypothetical protein
MKKTKLFLFLIAGLLAACVNEDELHNDIDYEGNSAVIRSTGLSNINLSEVSGNFHVEGNQPKGRLRIEGRQNIQDILEINNSANELRIRSKGGPSGPVVVDFYLHPDDISRIVIEGTNKVGFSSTPVLDYLELVTEGSSELVMEQMQVRNLNTRREGSSRMHLSSQLSAVGQDSLYFIAGDVQLVGDNHLIYTEENVDYILSAPMIRTSNDSVFAIGSEMERFFLTHSHELRNEGGTYLDALLLPTLNVTSKNEGNSESNVWAIDFLDVHAQGESTLRYRGNPEVSEKLEGNASLIRLE